MNVLISPFYYTFWFLPFKTILCIYELNVKSMMYVCTCILEYIAVSPSPTTLLPAFKLYLSMNKDLNTYTF